MQPTLKLIAFDLFGVVISDGHLVTHGLLPLLPPTVTKAAVKPYYDAYTGGQISEVAFWEGIGLTLESPIRQQFLNFFELDADLAAVTYVLSQRYRLGILSNLGAEWGDMLEARFAFSERFEPRIISGAVKCQKPEPAIYEVLIKASGVGGEHIAFIDDRRENLAVAKRFGMTTIHYRREADAHPFEPDYTIESLADVLAIL
ncbi:HAD family hydrolase [Thiothrix winogradskyi]|uniref:HAD-IA family hydrolase n=1 Tax=Thiothrix winogradskyi TaxID=96472 RepID=A0ABY3T020_9GAMM|nr:HAD-IA family hydrolase [Thiothrix winogradskyi]UJS24158.1 HAD-IA family hydrolase [Thiothrix winogradskyi]